jgi:hypothetical protein
LVADGGGRGAGVLVERAGDALARSRSEASISTSQFDSTPNWPTATSRTTRAVARHPWRDAGRHDHRHRRWAGRAIDQGAFTCSPGAAVQCGLTDLAPGESESLEVHIRSLRPGRLIDDVTASDDQFDPNYANDSATVIATVTPRATAARVRIVPVRRVATPRARGQLHRHRRSSQARTGREADRLRDATEPAARRSCPGRCRPC